MEGWIKLHRKFSEKAFYSKDSEKVHLWIHLLLKANHSGYEEMLGGKPIRCNPGQFTTGRKQLAKETGICESKVERILSYFEKTEQQIEQQKTSSNRLITVLRWEQYQESEQQSEQQVNNDRTTSEQQVNTLQECKEVKNERNNNKSFDLSFVDPLFLDSFLAWLSYKKERKDSYKGQASIKMAYDKLLKESDNNPSTAKQMIENSIANNWKGFFPLKENQNKSSDIGVVLHDTKKDYKAGLW